MNNKVILESLASDLKRVSLGLQRGSLRMAKRFTQEALKRKKEVDTKKVDKYIVMLLGRMEKDLQMADDEKKAEDALMYSTLFQNYALYKH